MIIYYTTNLNGDRRIIIIKKFCEQSLVKNFINSQIKYDQ